MAKKVQFTTNQPSASTDYLAADNTWKTMSGGGGGGTVTSVALTTPAAFNVSGSPITTSGTLSISGAGTASQYVKGDGTLGTTATSLPPSGSAGGDLSGTYPNPTVSKIHGVDMQSGTPSTDEVWVYGGSPAKWQHQKLHASQTTNDSTVSGTNVDDALDTLKTTKQDTITGAATTVTTTDLTGSRVLVSNPGGKIAVSAVTTTEVGYLVGVTSDIQTQLNNKQTTVSLTTTGNSGAATFNPSTGALNIPQYSTGYGLNLIQKAAYGYEYYNDFLNLSANILTGFSDGNGIQAAFSGTGTTVTSSIAPAVRATNQHGFMQPTTGSTASSHAGIHMSSSTALLLGGGAMTFNTSVLFNTASTSSERYRAVIGYANTATNGAESNGIFFTYDEGGTANGTAASPNWQCLTIAGSVRTLTTTSTAVSFTAWQKLSIEINAAGTSVQFFVDNTLVATHTTNIPSGTSQLIFPKIFIVKAIGTTSRYYHCDYIYYSQTYTTQKPV